MEGVLEKAAQHRDQINHLIGQWRNGDRDAYNQLFSLLYEDLKNIAHRLFMRERNDHTMQTEDLVSKLYLKMLGSKTVPWDDYAHFLRSVARTMRQILIDHARSWQRHGGQGKVSLEVMDEGAAAAAASEDRIIALNQAIEKMEAMDPKMARVVDLKLSLGMTLDEISQTLDISLTGAKREWSIAKKILGKQVWGMNPTA